MRLHSRHLADLLADATAVATRLADADPAARRGRVRVARRESSRMSVRLDASPLDDATADEVDRRESQGLPPVDEPAGGLAPPARVTAGWARALKVDRTAVQEVAAQEYANLLACFDEEPVVAGWFLDRPREALGELHTRLCRGLLEPGAAGRPRRTELAVHDGAEGRVLYHPAAPDRIDALLDDLARWLSGPAAAQPGLVVAGVVHERILQWQPFEAANGRLARVASRVVLRARGVDPDGLAVTERALIADPAGYYTEVAATIRRRDDLAPWLERYAEAVVAGLVAAAQAVATPAASPPPRAEAVACTLQPGDVLTLAGYAQQAGTTRGAARDELRALVASGLVEAVPGSRGLRFRRR